MSKPQILIYQDYIHNNGQLYAALTGKFGHGAVGYCDATDITAGVLNHKIRLFVMPGGADLYYCEKLDGDGNALIRAYVENGGSYLGICAGAYYACAAIEWAKETDQEICEQRELALYSGIATGPIQEFLQDRTITKSWLHAAPLIFHDGQTILETKTVYEGGPVFSEKEGKVLACYQDGRAAIVECTFGKGMVILSSPHIERLSRNALYRHGNSNHAHELAILAELSPYAEKQALLWDMILNRLIADRRQQSDAA